MFIFFSFSLQTFGGKLNLMPRGERKIGQNSLFPPIQPFATLCNEWQNKISVGDAILCWIAGFAI